MQASRGFSKVWLAAAALLLWSCSSGLEGDDAKGARAARQPAPSTNLRFGFDPCLRITHPITDYDLAGAALPTSSGAERPVVFFTFVTEAAADDGDGMGTPLDPDAPADANAASDVFVAAVDTDAIDQRAFVYSLAGKMRHPRCTTCHQMNVDLEADPSALPPTAFATAAEGHPGMPPLRDTSEGECRQCHFPDWKAPAMNFDLRSETAQALFGRAQIAPTGLAEHFLRDPRVTWALGVGLSPFGNAADDDHDGVREPEDTDGIVRTVPGGAQDFRRRFEDWEASGLLFDSAEDALQDIALASRNSAGTAAANGAAFRPSTIYFRNQAYMHGVSDPDIVPVGFLRVALASDATDMAGGAANGVTDVYRITLRVFQRSDASVDLEYQSQVIVSAAFGGGNANNASTDPDLSGAAGERVAFHSLATNLLSGVTAADNVYVRDVALATTGLVSHVPGSPGLAGNGPSTNPDLSADGTFVAFESEATDLVPGDTNGVRDVFFADWSTLGVSRASVDADGNEGNGGPSRNPSVYAFPGGAGVRVAFESEKQDLVAEMPLADRNVFLRDTRGAGTTLLLNQIVGPRRTELPTSETTSGAPAPADAFDPVISPAGNAVLFVSMAQDLDFVRPRDENRETDVVLVDLLQLDAQGLVLPYALSVTAEGGNANGPSHSPTFAAFVRDPAALPETDAFPLGLAGYATRDTNLGNPDPADVDGNGVPDGDNHMLLFLREGASVLAAFEARPARQGVDQEVAFENQSSGNPTSFLWDFGDGSTSTEENPTHVYTSEGCYTVSLDVSGELGTDTRRRTDYVDVLGPVGAMFVGTKDAADSEVGMQTPFVGVPNTMPILGALDDPSPTSLLRFDFDSAPSTQFPDEFEWSVVEVDATGTPIGAPTLVSTDAMAQGVPLDRVGLFDVQLVATGPGGAGTATQRLEVHQKVDASFIPTTAVSGNAPLNVSFLDQSAGDVASLLWDFDDGSSSTLPAPTHMFAEGVFDVVLRAFGAGSDQDDSVPLQIVSFGPITANFTANPDEAIASGPVVVSFTNTTSGTSGVTLFYNWDFGNGQSSSATNPSSSFSLSNPENRRQFTVTLVASTTNPAPSSCSGMGPTECDEQTGTITLFPALSVDFSFGSSFSSQPTRPPHTVAFTGSVVGDGTGTNPAYQWFRSTPGGATANILFATSLSPTIEFTDPGIYRVLLRVSTDAPNGGRQSADSPTRNVTVDASTFTEFYNEVIVANSCTSCHGATPSAGLDWRIPSGGTVADVRLRLVNVNSGCFPAPPPNYRRVLPNSPADSTLYEVLAFDTPPSGCDSMRPNVSTGFADNHALVARSWILDGAPNN